MKSQIICCFLLVFLLGCTHKKEIPTVSFDIKGTSCNVAEVLTDREIVCLETKKESLLAEVGKIIRYEDKIYIWDRFANSVVVFDTSGKYVSAIRPSGKGLWEYIAMSNFTIDRKNKRLIIYANRPGKLLFYDLDCRVKNELAYTSLAYSMVWDKDRLVLVNSPVGKKGKPYFTFLTFDGEDKISSKKLSSFTNEVSSSRYVWAELLLNSEKLTFARRYENVLYSLEGEKVVPRYQLDFKGFNLPERLYDPGDEEEDKNQEITQKGYIFSVVDVKETPSFIFFRTNRTGMMRIIKNPLKGEFWYRFVDEELGLDHYNTIGVEDPSNRMICFFRSTQREDGQTPAWLAEKMKKEEEGDNPVLIFYKWKE